MLNIVLRWFICLSWLSNELRILWILCDFLLNVGSHLDLCSSQIINYRISIKFIWPLPGKIVNRITRASPSSQAENKDFDLKQTVRWRECQQLGSELFDSVSNSCERPLSCFHVQTNEIPVILCRIIWLDNWYFKKRISLFVYYYNMSPVRFLLFFYRFFVSFVYYRLLIFIGFWFLSFSIGFWFL